MKVAASLGLVSLVSLIAVAYGGEGIGDRQGVAWEYSIQQVEVEGATEHRFMSGARHFMTLIDDNGVFVLRPHPGVAPNGWGSSWYAQPFLPGAVLMHTTINSVSPGDDGISVDASGGVSYGESSTYGTWTITMLFDYTAGQKQITGAGHYSITLDAQLNDTTGDLNLYKIATNYLDDVPLLSGGIGDTGDMAQADVVGDTFSFTWSPPAQPSHFPNDITDHLSIEVPGQYNEVDTAAQGYEPIAPAYKPSLKVVLMSQEAGLEMTFGAVYDWDKRQDFWEDNVGITPLVLRASTDTEFNFDVEFESRALPGDGSILVGVSPSGLASALAMFIGLIAFFGMLRRSRGKLHSVDEKMNCVDH